MSLSDRVKSFIRTVFLREQTPKKEPRGLHVPDWHLFSQLGYTELAEQTKLEYDLLTRYSDYEDMDDMPEIGSTLDLVADDATQPDIETGKTVTVEAELGDIKDILTFMFDKVLKIDEFIWDIARSLAKYGNDYNEILVSDEGVVGINFLPAPTMRRIEKERGYLVGFVQSFQSLGYVMSADEFEKRIKSGQIKGYKGTSPEILFEPWEVVHMRFMSKFRKGQYGYAITEPARWIWKRLLLLEDAMLVYRLTRSPSRFVVYVDVGDLPPQEAFKYVNKVKQYFKKKRVIEPNTSAMSYRYNPLCLSLDVEIPLLDGRQLTLKQLIDEYKNGKENWVYSIDLESNRIVPGKIIWAGVTRKNAELVEIELDNYKKIKTTPDHKFILRDGTMIEAQFLQCGDSLMPFQKQKKYANHKVIGVKKLNYREDTGCITVEPWGNFAVGADIFIKNSSDEDFFIPVRGGREAARIDTLEGPTYTGLDDIEYFRSKLFAALKVPKAYLAREEGTTRSTLAQEDIRWARTILRIQREIRNGLKKICDVHLSALGIDPYSVNFDVVLNIPSAIFELAQLEVKRARAEFADSMEKWTSYYWIMSNVFGFSDEEIELILKQREIEKGGATAESFKKYKESQSSHILPKKELLTEENLFEGNREHERFLEDNFEKVLKNNPMLHKNIHEIKEFMDDIRANLTKIK